MHLQTMVADFYDVMELIDTPERLSHLVTGFCNAAGISYFALTHHVDLSENPNGAVHLNNYPADFTEYYYRNGLMTRDPVHRVSQLRGAGFMWSALPSLIELTTADTQFLQEASQAGLVEGYTVPVHIPGEHTGSCSFAVSKSFVSPRESIPLLEALGRFSFDVARRLALPRSIHSKVGQHLTQREREIVILLGQGKREKEIARVLGLAPVTVNDHLKRARRRFGVHKSTLLVTCGLLTGSIVWNDLLS
jgi:LuxR family quorum-sensing system transcriptional regulator CciR